ncbi:MAG: DDE-type integrase/transposase/recombinase [Candidatus Nitrosocosmicus sp.]|nr:DDE-type integrase/transposase/recombinase [Candidatus Nitrosocosmicus sp.]
MYFSGLSLRKASERLSQMYKRNHVLLAKKWNWIQKYKPLKIQSRKRKILGCIVDETLIKIGSKYIWILVAIEPENTQILVVTVSRERNMLIAERFLSDIVRNYGKHLVSTDGGS